MWTKNQTKNPLSLCTTMATREHKGVNTTYLKKFGKHFNWKILLLGDEVAGVGILFYPRSEDCGPLSLILLSGFAIPNHSRLINHHAIHLSYHSVNQLINIKSINQSWTMNKHTCSWSEVALAWASAISFFISAS